MSEPLSAVVVAAGRSQRMGFDKLLTPLGGQPLLVHTLERLLATQVPREVVLVVRPGTAPDMDAVIAPLREKGNIRLVDGGRAAAGLGLRRAQGGQRRFRFRHGPTTPRGPFVTKEMIDLVLAAARLSDAAVCGAPCSDSLKNVGEDGLVVQTVDRSQLWSVQTPQIFRTKLLRDAYSAALKTGETFTDDTAVIEKMGHPVRIVLYHGVNLKVTTPSDWQLAEALLRSGEGDNSPGQVLRKQMHDMNNHLTPLLGYAYLLVNEMPEDSRGKKFAKSIQMAAERCQATTATIQKLVRELFPKKGE